ncbi:MAG: signal recognition particle-docking protein FtsY, partial [Paracoccaceae bacterium]
MAFFAKLKERLFKSSSKLEEGLDAIVDDGGVIEEADEELVADLALDQVIREDTDPQETISQDKTPKDATGHQLEPLDVPAQDVDPIDTAVDPRQAEPLSEPEPEPEPEPDPDPD